MSDLAPLLAKCRRLGLELWAEGDRIGIAPKQRIPAGLLEEIREMKPSLLAILRESQAHQLPADCIPWIHTAKQILSGEFDASDRSTISSLIIGLRSISHPLCQKALARLSAKSQNSTSP
jgi:hypothetical protein